ncbi:uncharacterized protein [Antedon mediterranea]|uniref:uncharacterized protein n=1 Tax=Antedon mediterranea TaxID=105859 RepID=UPI003AF8DE47
MSLINCYLAIAIITLTITKKTDSADTKVLILGAGASGLNAAQTLHYKGENDFIILEAEDYYGGRVHNERILDEVVEMGANWIHPVGSKLEELAKAIDMNTRRSDFEDLIALTDKGADVTDDYKLALERFDDKLNDVITLGEKYIKDDEADISLSLGLRNIGWKAKTPEEILAEWFRVDFDLADGPERASLLAYAADKLYVEEKEDPVVEDNFNSNSLYEEYRERTDLVLVKENDPYNYRNRDDDWENNNWSNWYDDYRRRRRRRRQTVGKNQQEQFVIDRQGYKSIFNRTMSFLLKTDQRDNIRFNKVVERIDYSDSNEVTVYCTDGTRYTAEYVLVTFSLGVLQSDLIQFDPPLPAWKTDYWNRFEMAAYSKIFMNFQDDKFWGNTEWIANVDNNRKQGQWPLFLNFAHEDLYLQDTHLLMAIITGDEARRVESLTVDEIKKEAEENLDEMYNRYTVPRPRAIMVSNWTQNPYTLGSFAFWSYGTDRGCFGKMESRVDKVFFAGEATSLNNTGNLQGALESGKREGLKIYDCLQGGSCGKWNTKTKCGCGSTASGISFVSIHIVVLFSVLFNKIMS